MKHLFSSQDPALVLFDLDGTLVDSVPDLAQAIDRMLTSLGRPVAGLEAVSHWVGNGAPMLVKRALTGEMCPDLLDDALFDKGYRSFLKFYAQATADQSVLYPGVIECLSELKGRGIKLGLVTNKPMRFTTSMLKGFELTDYFDVVLGGDSLPRKKPDPLPLQEAMRVCGALPEMTLMVGDSISDLSAARAAGCQVACVPYGYNHGKDIFQSEPDLKLESLYQLM